LFFVHATANKFRLSLGCHPRIVSLGAVRPFPGPDPRPLVTPLAFVYLNSILTLLFQFRHPQTRKLHVLVSKQISK